MCRVKNIIISCLCLVSSFVFALHSSASYALDLNTDVNLIQGNFQGQMRVYAVPFNQTSNVPQCNLNMNNWTNAIFLGADCAVNGMSLSIPQRQYNVGDWIVVNLNTSYPEFSASNHMVYYGAFYSGSNPVDLVQQDVSNLDTNSGHITLYFRAYGSFNDNALNINGRSQILNANTTNNTVIVRVNSVSVYHEKASYDYSQDLNSINNGIGSMNNNINDLKNSQNQSNQDANNRYNDEKNTINDNGDNTSNAWSDNSDNLKFDAPTGLFNWFWSLGTTDQCVDITTLARLIHSQETQYCSWYPTEIRSIVSPIINLFLVCFISGFVIKWLKKDGI